MMTALCTHSISPCSLRVTPARTHCFTLSTSRRRQNITVRAAGKDNDQKVDDAQKKLDDKRADLKGQLDVMANATLDGDFEKQEMQAQKEKLEEGLKELDSLQKELKSAAKSDKEA